MSKPLVTCFLVLRGSLFTSDVVVGFVGLTCR